MFSYIYIYIVDPSVCSLQKGCLALWFVFWALLQKRKAGKPRIKGREAKWKTEFQNLKTIQTSAHKTKHNRANTDAVPVGFANAITQVKTREHPKPTSLSLTHCSSDWRFFDLHEARQWEWNLKPLNVKHYWVEYWPLSIPWKTCSWSWSWHGQRWNYSESVAGGLPSASCVGVSNSCFFFIVVYWWLPSLCLSDGFPACVYLMASQPMFIWWLPSLQ